MDALRHLSWSQFRLNDHPQTSQASQATLPSTLSGSSTVKDFVLRIESNHDDDTGDSTEEPWPRSPTCRSLIPHPSSSHSQEMSPILDSNNAGQLVHSKVVHFESESILGSYLQLPALPKDLGGDFGREFVERFTQSRLAHALDSAVDDSDDLPSIPDTATGYARFGFISRESFNTAVQDLVQQYPDNPIGGKEAAPMKTPSNIGTLVIDSKSTFLDGPQSDTSSPPHTPDHGAGREQALRARHNFSSNFSDSFHETNELRAEHNTSVHTPAMVTAPQSPNARRRKGMSSFAVDGPGGGHTEVKDFAQLPPLNHMPPEPIPDPLPDCCVSPRSVVSDGIYNEADRRAAKENLPGAGYSNLGPIPELSLDKSNAPAVAGMSAGPNSNGTVGAEAPNTEAPSRGQIPGLPQVPVAKNVEIQKPNASIDVPQVPELEAPIEGTGQLVPPATSPKNPKKDGKRKTALRGGQKAIRKGRSLILKRPVLAVVVGRQLSGPTAQALKLISEGVPLDVGDLPPVSRVTAPVPGVPV